MLKCLRLGLSVSCVLALATPALADPIQITSGSVELGSFVLGSPRSSSFGIAGDGFRILGAGADSAAPGAACSEFHPCTIGDPVINTDHHLVVTGIGSATVNGTSVFARTGMSGVFTAEDVLITQNVGGVFQTPFTFTGTASFSSLIGPLSEGQFPVVGQGILSVFLAGPSPGGLPFSGLHTTGVQFKFLDAAASPAPEPASLLLLGTGAAFLYRRSRSLRSAA